MVIIKTNEMHVHVYEVSCEFWCDKQFLFFQIIRNWGSWLAVPDWESCNWLEEGAAGL